MQTELLLPGLLEDQKTVPLLGEHLTEYQTGVGGRPLVGRASDIYRSLNEGFFSKLLSDLYVESHIRGTFRQDSIRFSGTTGCILSRELRAGHVKGGASMSNERRPTIRLSRSALPPMKRDTLYYGTPRSTYVIGRGTLLICNPARGSVVVLDEALGRVLAFCDGARTITDHIRQIRVRTAETEESIRTALESLIDLGLLQPIAVADRGVGESPSLRIGAIGLITADRPAALARALSQAVNHAHGYSRDIEFLVVDGSKMPDNQVHTRAVVEQFRRRANVVYVGPAERHQIVSVLSSSALPATLLESAICAGTTGANRTLLSLLTAGRAVLMVDDDMRWDTWQLPNSERCHQFVGHVDCLESQFFASRQDAVAAIFPTSVDLLDAHEQLLGRNAPGLLQQDSDLTHACIHVLLAVTGVIPATVRVTMTGFAGDVGIHCPYRLLFAQGPTRRTLCSDPTAFLYALSRPTPIFLGALGLRRSRRRS